MREKLLKKLAHWHATYPWRMLVIVFLLTIFFAGFAGQLTVTMQTSDLMPANDPKVVEYNKILDEFVTATNLVVVVQGDEKRIKSFADELAPRILELTDSASNDRHREEIAKLEKKIDKLKTQEDKESKISELRSKIDSLEERIDLQLFQRVDYKAEVDFLRNHLLMLIKADDLKNTKDIFMDPNIVDLVRNLNDSMEKEYVGQEESISTREKEDGAVQFLDGIQNLVIELKKAVEEGEVSESDAQDAADRLLLGEPYMLSYDKTTLLLIAIPNFTIMDRDLLMVGTDAVQGILDDLLMEFPDVEAGLSGSIAREHDEQIYGQQSMSYSTLIALVVILILLIVSFRMWVAPVFAIGTLIVGVVWAMGAAWLAVGQLNMMTSMMAVVLLGLGIDFAIHMITGFTEWRASGDTITTSLEKTFLKSGKGIITGALTTACAFLTLIISQARGMREMGIVIGVGLLSILLATLFCLPVMLVFRERRIDKKRARKQGSEIIRRDISFRFLGRMAEWLSRGYVFTILAFLVISVLLGLSASNMTFDHNYMNIEPEGLKSITLTDTILEKFDLNIEYALFLADSVDESRKFAAESRDKSTVAFTDDISVYLPSKEQQAERIPYIEEVRKSIETTPVRTQVEPDELLAFKSEIERLEMNIMEMQDMAYLGGQDKVDNKCKEIVGDPDNPDSGNVMQDFLRILEGDNPGVAAALSQFQRHFASYYKDSVRAISSTAPIELDELPVTILDRYSNKSRDQFMVTVFPSGNIWANKQFNDRFVEDMESVSERVTGMPPLFTALIKIFGRDGRNAVLLTLVLVFILLMVDFQSPRYALMAMIPLAFGMLWMLGFMHIFGMKINIVNIIGLPLIVGIGIDDGVHIMHRWQHEGKDKIRTVFSSTGKAIFLTSLTTMFAFGSLVFSIFRGWASFGAALFLGVGACFLTTTFILPGILGLIERKK
jgi:predicted RND superfamily exporter protein